MANIKFSELDTGTLTDSDEFAINDGGVSKKITGSDLKTYVGASQYPTETKANVTGEDAAIVGTTFLQGNASNVSVTLPNGTNIGQEKIFICSADNSGASTITVTITNHAEFSAFDFNQNDYLVLKWLGAAYAGGWITIDATAVGS